MPEYRAPGVRIGEESFRHRQIEGVATSTTAFAGATGAVPPRDTPELLTSVGEYERLYGDSADLTFADGTRTAHFLWHAARAFFANGGRRLFVAPARRKDGRPPGIGEFQAALEQLERITEIGVVAAPGATLDFEMRRQESVEIVRALLEHAERMRNRFAVVDCGNAQTPANVAGMRASFDSSFGALYYPWLRVTDPATGQAVHVPPSGFVCGVYARVDLNRGVWKAPANEPLALASRLEHEVTLPEQRRLNTAHVNCLRHVPGRGLRVMGARTLSSDGDWKYINVRRLLIFLEASIEQGLQWVVFEPNGEPLWISVRAIVEDFLMKQWGAGALVGVKPEEAFFVRCDRTTMTQSDIDDGRLVCLVGVAPIRPAEFVIFRIGQWTADRKP
jgi:phage tail sheath protein FI